MDPWFDLEHDKQEPEGENWKGLMEKSNFIIYNVKDKTKRSMY